jgi:hypothetical protein
MNSESTICIMADFGFGPYAWLRGPELSRPRVGGNIADSVSGFPEEYNISAALQADFAEWITEFEREWENPKFDWNRWNHTGISLAKRLKSEVGNRFMVEYHYPFEDPTHGSNPGIIEINEEE